MVAKGPILSEIPAEALEDCRRAIAWLLKSGKAVGVTPVRKRAKRSQTMVAPIVRAYKAGELPELSESWAPFGSEREIRAIERIHPPENDESTDRAELARIVGLIRAAETDDDRRRVRQEACALALEGKLDRWHVTVVEKTLAQARADAKSHRTANPSEKAEQFVLCGSEAYSMVRVYEGIVSEERRLAVLGFLAEKAEEDAAENPGIDTSPGAAKESVDE